MTRAISALADAIIDRSGDRCEAVWTPGYRCLNRADAFHHRIPRSRARHGDEHLGDLAGDTDGIGHLCRPCHDAAHASPARAETAHLSGPFGAIRGTALRYGITVPGNLHRIGTRTVYVGPSLEYATRYPPEPNR